MEKPAAKRVRLSTEDVLLELENDDEPVTAGSDDKFDDITCEEKERDEWGETDSALTTHSHYSPEIPSHPVSVSSPHSMSMSPSHSMSVSPSHSLTGSPPHSVLGSGPSHTLPASSLGTLSGIGQLQTLPSRSLSGSDTSHTLPVSSLNSSGRQVSSSDPLFSRESVRPLQAGRHTTSPFHLSGGPSSSQSPSPGRSSTYFLSGRTQTRTMSSLSGEISSSPSTTEQGTTASNVDPLSLPLSAYFSLPLSSLVQALNQGMNPPSSHTVVPTPTTSNLPVPSAPSHPSTQHQPAQHHQSQPAHQYPQSQRPHSGNTVSSGSWSRNLEPIDVAPFVEEVGPTVEIPGVPVDVFNLFFTDDLCSHITEQTNLYAQQVMGTRYATWDQVSMAELRAYFGFNILMGIVTEPAAEDYWRRDELHFSPIADRISRKRFRDIHRFLHFTDNTRLTSRGQPGYDRLGKVRPVMNMVQTKIRDLYKPHCENAMDEAMIKFDGWNKLKQYMPAKPVKRGIKV